MSVVSVHSATGRYDERWWLTTSDSETLDIAITPSRTKDRCGRVNLSISAEELLKLWAWLTSLALGDDLYTTADIHLLGDAYARIVTPEYRESAKITVRMYVDFLRRPMLQVKGQSHSHKFKYILPLRVYTQMRITDLSGSTPLEEIRYRFNQAFGPNGPDGSHAL